MESGAPIVVLDLYDWLPSYGESRIRINSRGSLWTIEIVYEDQAGPGLWLRPLRFEGVSCFHYASINGPAMLNVQSQGRDTLGSLVEYPASQAAAAWNKRSVGEPIKHYSVLFLSESLTLHIFAKRVSLGEPSPTSS